MKNANTLTAFIVAVLAIPSIASAAECKNSGAADGAAPPIFDDQGGWKQRATASVPCGACDADSVGMAVDMAREEAEGMLTAYLDKVRTGSSSSKSSGSMSSSNDGTTSKSSGKFQREYVKTVQSSYSGIMSGVVTLEDCVLPEDKKVRVTVGVSSKTQADAESRKARPVSGSGSQPGTSQGQGQNGARPIVPAKSESRSSNERDF